MKLAVISDIHVDFFKDYGEALVKSLPDSEVLIVAGDVIEGASRLNKQRNKIYDLLCNKYGLVIAVKGNHDYWHTSPEKLDAEIASYGLNNLEILTVDHKVTFNGYTFKGDTLWYPGRKDPHYRYLKNSWPDFRYIHNFEPWVYQQNQAFRDKISSQINKGDIVVSHMLPSKICVAPEYEGSETNVFFLSDESKYIREREPALWIFGHTHMPFDLQYAKTRLYCNTLGYPDEGMNPNFIDRILIDI
jgi:predicted phosphodiesterase